MCVVVSGSCRRLILYPKRIALASRLEVEVKRLDRGSVRSAWYVVDTGLNGPVNRLFIGAVEAIARIACVCVRAVRCC